MTAATDVTSILINQWRGDIGNDQRFARTHFVVADCDYQSLWFRWAELHRVPWDEDTHARTFQLAALRISENTLLQARELVGFDAQIFMLSITVTWVAIGPALVAFIECPSLIVHHGLIQAWLRTVFVRTKTSYSGTNFHVVIEKIAERFRTSALIKRLSPMSMLHLELDDGELIRASEDELRKNPQAAYEYADAKIQWWAERAKTWRTICEQPNAPISRIVEMTCGVCEGKPQAQSIRARDKLGDRHGGRCLQCDGRGKVKVQL